MTRSLFQKSVLFVLAPILLWPDLAQADARTHLLEVNRSLLSRFEAEYATLNREEAENPSESTKRKLLGAKYKVAALRDEAARLRSALPPQKAAEEYLKDFIAAKTASPPPPALPRPATRPNRTAAAMHEEALWYVSQKKFSDAIRVYEEIVLSYPDDDEAYMLLGHTCLLSGEYSKAEYAFSNAVRIEPNDLGQILPFYQGLVLQNPDDDVAHSCLGYALLILEDPAGAKQAFQDALDINPENREAVSGLQIALGAQIEA